MSSLYENVPIQDGIDFLSGHRTDGSDEEPIFLLSASWFCGAQFLQTRTAQQCLLWGEPYGHGWLLQSLADQIRTFRPDWPPADSLLGDSKVSTLAERELTDLSPPIEALVGAHQMLFEEMFQRPAKEAGATRWGITEVRWTADHAKYLRLMFPKAKLLFLYRSPYEAYSEYYRYREQWMIKWPNIPLTCSTFALHWRALFASFLESHRELDAFMVKYEDLIEGDLDADLEEYLGFPLAENSEQSEADQSKAANSLAPTSHLLELERLTGELASEHGYQRDVAPAKAEPATTRVGPGAASAALPDAKERPDTKGTESQKSDNSKCIIIVRVRGHIEPACEEALRALEARSYKVRRIWSFSAVDAGRCMAAVEALAEGYEELMWIDSLIAFHPDAVERLRSHSAPLVLAGAGDDDDAQDNRNAEDAVTELA